MWGYNRKIRGHVGRLLIIEWSKQQLLSILAIEAIGGLILVAGKD